MNQSRFKVSRPGACAALIAALALPLAAHAAEDAAKPDGKGGMQMHHMHDKHCPMMMKKHHRMPTMVPMPRLPRGNDKLQMQMEAEILQKIGEIQGKYANQLP